MYLLIYPHYHYTIHCQQECHPHPTLLLHSPFTGALPIQPPGGNQWKFRQSTHWDPSTFLVSCIEIQPSSLGIRVCGGLISTMPNIISEFSSSPLRGSAFSPTNESPIVSPSSRNIASARNSPSDQRERLKLLQYDSQAGKGRWVEDKQQRPDHHCRIRPYRNRCNTTRVD